MSSLADFDSDLAAALAGIAGTPSRMVSDLAIDREVIPVGGHRFQLVVWSSGRFVESNSSYETGFAGITVHHRLADPEDERAYTGGVFQGQRTELTRRGFWEDLASVFELVSFEQDEPERVGHVITHAQTAVVRIAL